jgi:tRNA-splicing ligase RtcB
MTSERTSESAGRDAPRGAIRLDKWRLRLPRQGAMTTDGIVFADAALARDLVEDQALQQVRNVATLPGIVGCSLAMPDVHWGYGFPIGGVAAFDAERGVISPGGIGFDINCGVRLLRTPLTEGDVRRRLSDLVRAVAREIPAGIGSKRADVRLDDGDLESAMARGVEWAIEAGFGVDGDAERLEANGAIAGADPGGVSPRARERGLRQMGTLGSGNHFVEIGVVDEIHDAEAARAFGLEQGGVTVLIHTGSRGLGHQVCEDFLETFQESSRRHGIALVDRQLACAPLSSPEGKRYLGAMSAAANFAFCNRQLVTHFVRVAFARVLGTKGEELSVVYDVAHNIAKIEEHVIDGAPRRVCVHRKGATRAFPAGHPELPSAYREVGQPVIVPGDMGRSSFVLVGQPRAMEETFGSCCHGAGRLLSRAGAKKRAKGRDVIAELAAKGIVVQGASRETVVEEMPEAYKDVADVVRVVEGAGIAKKVARLKPMGVVKG